MSARSLASGALIAVALATACAKTTTTPSPSVTGVVVAGNGVFTNKNDTSQLTATANLSNSTAQDVTNSATWTSSTQAIATVTSTGLVTAVSNGSSTISAAYQGSTGSLAVIVSLRATAAISGSFQRLCGPFRARLEVTLAETGKSVGYNITSLTLTMRDLAGNVRAARSYSVAELTTLGVNHIDANSAKLLPAWEAQYTPVVDTEDSSASISATITDDAGNTQTITVSPIRQSDRC